MGVRLHDVRDGEQGSWGGDAGDGHIRRATCRGSCYLLSPSPPDCCITETPNSCFFFFFPTSH